jgi:hypothetical protein
MFFSPLSMCLRRILRGLPINNADRIWRSRNAITWTKLLVAVLVDVPAEDILVQMLSVRRLQKSAVPGGSSTGDAKQ